jgi:FkbM family methyltransferase
MNVIEQVSIKLRHSSALSQAGWLWDLVRPGYDKWIAFIGRKGLERNFNGTDLMLLHPQFRAVTEVYEPETWQLLRSEVRPGDSVADVGCYIGIYAIALARYVGPSGRVYAFEPNEKRCNETRRHLRLNQVDERVELVRAAVGDQDGNVPFDSSTDSQGHISVIPNEESSLVPCMRLDTFLAGRSLDVLKIDVEGYEEFVLRGAAELLGSPERRPRAIFIEVHPYAWPELGCTSDSLKALLARHDYRVLELDGQPVGTIDRYGEIVAYRS